MNISSKALNQQHRFRLRLLTFIWAYLRRAIEVTKGLQEPTKMWEKLLELTWSNLKGWWLLMRSIVATCRFWQKNMLLVEINLRKEIASAGFLAFSHQTSSGRCKASDPWRVAIHMNVSISPDFETHTPFWSSFSHVSSNHSPSTPRTPRKHHTPQFANFPRCFSPLWQAEFWSD